MSPKSRGSASLRALLFTASLLATMAVAPAAHAGPPSLSWKAPTNGSTVQGVLRGSTCEAIAKDDHGVRNVRFFVDGKPANTEFYAPYNCTIDTRTLTNGGHVFKARATDTVNQVVERSINVTVANRTSTGTATPTTLNWPTNDTTTLPLGSELFSDGFDAGGLSKWYVEALPGRASVVSSPVAAGTGAARFEVRQGELEPATGDARAELTAPLHFYAGDERWFRVAVNFAQWDPAQTSWGQVWQLHDQAGPATVFHLMARQGTTAPLNVYLASNAFGRTYWSVDIDRSKWYEFLFHFKFSDDPNTGFVEVYFAPLGQTPALQKLASGRTRDYTRTHTDYGNLYMKLGIYRARAATGTSVVYHDSVYLNGA